jgi:hypothetical protein
MKNDFDAKKFRRGITRQLKQRVMIWTRSAKLAVAAIALLAHALWAQRFAPEVALKLGATSKKF